MSGAGRKVFQPGAVLTASQVQNYLQDQAVQYYAGTAARGSAIGTATTEGMMSYLADTDKLQLATGTATWVDVYPAVVNSSNLPAGSILQVIQNASINSTGTTSTSFVTAGLSASITPTSTSSRIMIIATSSVGYDSRNAFGIFTLFRGTTSGTNLGNGTAGMTQLYPAASASEWTNLALTYVDSPSTTSSQTYTLGMRLSGSGGTVSAQNGGATGIMLLLEIKG